MAATELYCECGAHVGRNRDYPQYACDECKELAIQPCETVGLEDIEGGCCKTCRARETMRRGKVYPPIDCRK